MSKMHPDLTLLLVEDDVLVRFTVEEILTDAGFGVTTVKNGTDAITALEGDIHRFCTDVQLGEGPDGWTVARRARELSATMPVIYMSGDSAADWSAQGVPASVMLQKPFADAQLVTCVSTVLNNVSGIGTSGL
jgi:DNA-binding response OmpR family regulator